MATCSDCINYQATDKENGTCFGHEVSADTESNQCPAKAFQAKEK